MGDIALQWDGEAVDLQISADDLVDDDGHKTAVLLSLFLDRRADAGVELPADDGDQRGWWGDEFAAHDGDRIGSRLWLLDRTTVSPGLAASAEELVREALAWMIEDSVVEAIDVSATIEGGIVMIVVEIPRPDASIATFRFQHAWDGEAAALAT